MPAPELAPEVDEDTPPKPEDGKDGSGAADPEEGALDDPEVMEVELTEEDYGGGLFTGVEDSDSTNDTTDESTEPVGSKADQALGFTDDHSNVEAAINEGAARLAVVGLDSEYKLGTNEDIEDADCLEAEFHDVFSAFRLGYFGAGFLDEYIFTDDDHVDPAWGLLGAMLCATAFTLWLRPDGDEILTDFTDALSGLGGNA